MSKTIQQEPIAAPFSWQGPYVGLHAGGTFGTAESMDLNFFDSPFPQGDAWNYDTSGFVGGAEAGYNWQRGHWVFGAESDLGYMNINGSGSHPLDSSTVTSTESDFYSTLRLRFGFAHDHWLFYGTGGAIVVHEDLSVDTARGSTSHSAFVPGWAGGGGIEYAFNDRWSLKAEYLYYELENDPVALRAPSRSIPGEDFRRTNFDMQNWGNIVRLGINYHFGAPAPMSVPITSDKGLSDKTHSGKEVMERSTMPTEEFSWTGAYVGVHLGGGSGGLDWNDEPPDQEKLVDLWQQGIFGGGQIGVNYQMGWVVLGVEGKFSGTGIDHHTELNTHDEPNIYDTNIDWMASAAIRAGVAIPSILKGHLLAYAKGGVSDVHQNYHWNHVESGQTNVYTSDENRFGPMVGGGFEYAINNHWTVHVEYDFADYGTKIIHGNRSDTPNIETEAYETKLRLHMFETGLSFKF